eukprot:CAMPEP_0115588340 /NCGR_PEP_ID=MMETSP0272-20121206/8665_1 /TAXON_ID=71861 /ORGANISM="Scrippsiella trochoidea, Strain CCMP3099" /LENGTH=75 /DNA_ID=CAMNT_0003023435 /DNA_START=1311 /DNA_END=1535 /DNA_ORIENTATION=-
MAPVRFTVVAMRPGAVVATLPLLSASATASRGVRDSGDDTGNSAVLGEAVVDAEPMDLNRVMERGDALGTAFPPR